LPVVLLAAMLAAGCARAPGPRITSDWPEPAGVLRAMSFNIRYGTAKDGANAWPNRRDLAIGVIGDFNPTVLGVQEALRFQLDEIRQELPWLGEAGVGREDGKEAGEYSAILYDSRRLTLLDHGTFWLSETPDVPGSKSWGNNITRIATWARLCDSVTRRDFVVLNTHWDHESQHTREQSGLQIVRWLASHAADKPLLVMGDFNAGARNPAFRTLVTAADRGIHLRDSYRAVPPDAGTAGTYHAFTGRRDGDKIDAILASPDWGIVGANIVTTSDNDRYPSDHFPVTARLALAP
jgi:endonuclease/exonuclease/phosphatase family metal-dependent hydrolase